MYLKPGAIEYCVLGIVLSKFCYDLASCFRFPSSFVQNPITNTKPTMSLAAASSSLPIERKLYYKNIQLAITALISLVKCWLLEHFSPQELCHHLLGVLGISLVLYTQCGIFVIELLLIDATTLLPIRCMNWCLYEPWNCRWLKRIGEGLFRWERQLQWLQHVLLFVLIRVLWYNFVMYVAVMELYDSYCNNGYSFDRHDDLAPIASSSSSSSSSITTLILLIAFTLWWAFSVVYHILMFKQAGGRMIVEWVRRAASTTTMPEDAN